MRLYVFYYLVKVLLHFLGPDHIIRLNLSAKYGYEYLFEELHKKFKKRIYSPRAYMYRCLPPIFKVLTDNPALSQIYASFKNEVTSVIKAFPDLCVSELNKKVE